MTQILMPRMSYIELEEIIDKALQSLGMTIAESAKNRIAQLSQGLPHYTHLLGLYSAYSASEKDRSNLTDDDVNDAITKSVESVAQSILDLHHKATRSSRRTLYEQVLLACALAPKDSLGYFAASDVRGPMTHIMGKEYDIPAYSQHLNDFCDAKRGPVLLKTGLTRSFRFRFANPLVQPFVILRGLKSGLIDNTYLQSLPKL